MNFEAKNVNEAAGLQMADERSLTLLTDRAAVSNLVLAFARALDGKDWMTCRRCLLDEIETDYSDLRGESPARVNADDLVAKRRVALERLKTLHLRTNHQVTVEGDRATCVAAEVAAQHRRRQAPSVPRKRVRDPLSYRERRKAKSQPWSAWSTWSM